MSFQPRPKKPGFTLRLWWQAHWTDFLSAFALAVFVFGMVWSISLVDLWLYRTNDLALQALALAILVGMFAGVVYLAVKD